MGISYTKMQRTTDTVSVVKSIVIPAKRLIGTQPKNNILLPQIAFFSGNRLKFLPNAIQ